MKKKLIGGLFSVLYTALMIFSLFVPNNIVPALVTALTSDSLPAELGSGATMPGWMVCGRHSSAGGKAGADALFQHAGNRGDPMGRCSLLVIFSPLYGPRCHPRYFIC